jgi:hypothetical protein
VLPWPDPVPMGVDLSPVAGSVVVEKNRGVEVHFQEDGRGARWQRRAGRRRNGRSAAGSGRPGPGSAAATSDPPTTPAYPPRSGANAVGGRARATWPWPAMVASAVATRLVWLVAPILYLLSESGSAWGASWRRLAARTCSVGDQIGGWPYSGAGPAVWPRASQR